MELTEIEKLIRDFGDNAEKAVWALSDPVCNFARAVNLATRAFAALMKELDSLQEQEKEN